MRQVGGLFACVLIQLVGGRELKWHSVFLARLLLIAFVSQLVQLKRKPGGRGSIPPEDTNYANKRETQYHNYRYHIRMGVMILNLHAFFSASVSFITHFHLLRTPHTVLPTLNPARDEDDEIPGEGDPLILPYTFCHMYFFHALHAKHVSSEYPS